MQKFSGLGGHPLLNLGVYGTSIFAPTALKLNVTPPKKILVTALSQGATLLHVLKGQTRVQLRSLIGECILSITDR